MQAYLNLSQNEDAPVDYIVLHLNLNNYMTILAYPNLAKKSSSGYSISKKN